MQADSAMMMRPRRMIRYPYMMTFSELCEGFLHASEPKASYKVYCRLVDSQFKGWPLHPSFPDVEDWHARIKATPHQANKGLSFLKAMYTWGIRRGHYQGQNPAHGVRQHRVFSRERVMTSSEVGLVLDALAMVPLKNAALTKVLMTTGCRLSEALGMQPQDVNLDTGKWRQPKTKNGKPHITYLPSQVREALRDLKHSEAYFFDGVYGHHLSRAGAEKTWWKLRKDLGLDDVRLHDFRRTLSTHLYRATKDEYLVKRCLNHMNPSVTAIYVRISEEEVARALQAQADRFFALAGPAPALEPILPLQHRRASDPGSPLLPGRLS